jgi:hypothetical protein
MIKQARSIHETAEILGRRRIRFFTAQAVLFCLWQATWVTTHFDGPVVRTVDRVGGLSWLAWAVILLAMVTTGGFLATPRAVREAMNDELSRANRADALSWGFGGAMAMAIIYYGIALFDVVPVFLALHSVVSVGIGLALGRFAYLERKASRDE